MGFWVLLFVCYFDWCYLNCVLKFCFLRLCGAVIVREGRSVLGSVVFVRVSVSAFMRVLACE